MHPTTLASGESKLAISLYEKDGPYRPGDLLQGYVSVELEEACTGGSIVVRVEGHIRAQSGEEHRVLHLRKSVWKATKSAPISPPTSRGRMAERMRRGLTARPSLISPPHSGTTSEVDASRASMSSGTSASAPDSSSQVLGAGRHHWPFQFRLPKAGDEGSLDAPPLPSTLSAEGITVEYVVTCVQEGMGGEGKGSTIRRSLPFPFRGHVSINQPELGAGWRERGKLGTIGDADVRVSRQGWMPGEEIGLRVKLPPLVERVKVELVMATTFFTDIQVQLSYLTVDSCEMLRPSVGEHAISVQVPIDAPLTVTQAFSLRVSYFLRVRVERDRGGSWIWRQIAHRTRGARTVMVVPLVVGSEAPLGACPRARDTLPQYEDVSGDAPPYAATALS